MCFPSPLFSCRTCASQVYHHLPHPRGHYRSEEHTSELQSHSDLVCRLLLEIKTAHVSTLVAPSSRMPSSAWKKYGSMMTSAALSTAHVVLVACPPTLEAMTRSFDGHLASSC